MSSYLSNRTESQKSVSLAVERDDGLIEDRKINVKYDADGSLVIGISVTTRSVSSMMSESARSQRSTANVSGTMGDDSEFAVKRNDRGSIDLGVKNGDAKEDKEIVLHWSADDQQPTVSEKSYGETFGEQKEPSSTVHMSKKSGLSSAKASTNVSNNQPTITESFADQDQAENKTSSAGNPDDLQEDGDILGDSVSMEEVEVEQEQLNISNEKVSGESGGGSTPGNGDGTDDPGTNFANPGDALYQKFESASNKDSAKECGLSDEAEGLDEFVGSLAGQSAKGGDFSTQRHSKSQLKKMYSGSVVESVPDEELSTQASKNSTQSALERLSNATEELYDRFSNSQKDVPGKRSGFNLKKLSSGSMQKNEVSKGHSLSKTDSLSIMDSKMSLETLMTEDQFYSRHSNPLNSEQTGRFSSGNSQKLIQSLSMSNMHEKPGSDSRKISGSLSTGNLHRLPSRETVNSIPKQSMVEAAPGPGDVQSLESLSTGAQTSKNSPSKSNGSSQLLMDGQSKGSSAHTLNEDGDEMYDCGMDGNEQCDCVDDDQEGIADEKVYSAKSGATSASGFGGYASAKTGSQFGSQLGRESSAGKTYTVKSVQTPKESYAPMSIGGDSKKQTYNKYDCVKSENAEAVCPCMDDDELDLERSKTLRVTEETLPEITRLLYRSSRKRPVRVRCGDERCGCSYHYLKNGKLYCSRKYRPTTKSLTNPVVL